MFIKVIQLSFQGRGCQSANADRKLTYDFLLLSVSDHFADTVV